MTQRIGRWAFAATVVASSLALGGIRSTVLFVVSLALSICAVVLSFDVKPLRLRRAAQITLFTAVGLTTFTALQSIPLPAAVIRALSPHAADVWAHALSPFAQQGPALHPLTLDPSATHIQILRGTTYILTLVCGLRIARSSAGVAFLSRLVLFATISVAIAHVAHVVTGADLAYGFYKPLTGVGAIGPFFNTNHLAGFLNLGLMTAAGSFASRRPIASRLVLGVIVVGLFGEQVWNASRGGVGCMIIGLLIVAVVRVGAEHEDGRKALAPPMLVAVGVLGTIAVLVLSAFKDSLVLLQDKDLSKLGVNRTCFDAMIPSYPLFGAGRGSFESTFPEFWHSRLFVVFTHPENFISQWTTEWGIPVTVLAIGALSFALRPRTALVRGDGATGAWAALIALALQNLVDFSSEIPSVMITAVVCVSVVVGGDATREHHSTTSEASDRILRWIVFCAVVNAAVGIVVLLEIQRELLYQKQDIYADVTASTKSEEAVRREIHDAMLSHPAEPYFPYLGGAHALSTDASVLPWAERTLTRAHSYCPVHLVLARWLRRRSPSQARLEYRLAAEEGCGELPAEIVTLVSSFDSAIELVPEGAAGVVPLEKLSDLLGARRPATQWQIDDEILRRLPSNSEAAERRAHALLFDIEDSASWCAHEDCDAPANAAIGGLERADPVRTEPKLLRAKLEASRGNAHAAIDGLRAGCTQVVDRSRCYYELASLAITFKRDGEATNAIDELSRACSDGEDCAHNLLLAAELEGRRGNVNRSLAFLRTASGVGAERPEIVVSYAVQMSRAGRHIEALDAYERLSRMRPDDPIYRQHVEEERGRIETAH